MKRIKMFEEVWQPNTDETTFPPGAKNNQPNVTTRQLHDKLKSGDLTPREITNMYFNPLIDNIQKLDNEISSELIAYYIQKLETLSQANTYNI
jgi:hypothetical protein